MDDAYCLGEEIDQMVEAWVTANMKIVPYDQIRERTGLDYRVGTVYVGEGAIAVPKFSQGSFEYYGGGEYISRDYRKEMGRYVFYFIDDSRVEDILARYNGVELEEEDDE